MLIFLIIGLLLGAAAVFFALQNITTITVTFLSWQFEGSLAVILLAAVVTGVLISLLLSLPGLIKKSFQISSLRNHNSKLEDELVDKNMEVESEKNKLHATNAYLDELENTPK